MKKGIIMEIKQDILVMMTPEGEFLTGRKQLDQQYAIGEEIPFFPIANKSVAPKPISRWNWKVSTSILTAMIVIVALFSSVILQNNKAYAYVSVDINPSMELALNHEQQVISITPFNEDAEMLLKELNDWEHDDVSEVTEKIFLLSEQMGYLKDNQNVLITSSFIEGSDHQRERDLIDELNEFVQGFRFEHNANIIVKETSPEIRDEASEKGMTAGSFIKESEDKKKVKKPSKTLEHEDAVVDEEKANPEMDKKDDRTKVQEQKVDPPVEEKKPKTVKPEDHRTNDKIHPQENKPREKPIPSQNRNSSNHNDESEYRSNREHNKSPHNESNNSHSRGNDNRHHEREDNKDEKKHDQHERKENKKD
ncbi:anti-sigma factor domain-containing protein [Bacillus sp. BHET2]|uniref:anti-sigma factor domain-containing protein n=1 Tax=Bacillus sp. BHET2 TaxID=2583818 RepID=UPI00110F2FA2|nr:anti-sigma factor domain-containing protein [Bacillus sp. BHET2]TMU88007.1 anti-sigma factor domain-containing protein [Bacillus sp. BHET2]